MPSLEIPLLLETVKVICLFSCPKQGCHRVFIAFEFSTKFIRIINILPEQHIFVLNGGK